jgi:hypothetical protein
MKRHLLQVCTWLLATSTCQRRGHQSKKPNPTQPWTHRDRKKFGRETSFNLEDPDDEGLHGSSPIKTSSGASSFRQVLLEELVKDLSDDGPNDDLHEGLKGLAAPYSTQSVLARLGLRSPLDPANQTSNSPRGQGAPIQLLSPNAIARLYRPAIYSYLMFDTVDIVFEMCQLGLVSDPVGPQLAHWFRMVSPGTLWKRQAGSEAFSPEMGPTRAVVIEQLLLTMLKGHDDLRLGPLHRALQRVFLVQPQQAEIPNQPVPPLTAMQERWLHFLRTLVAFGLHDSQILASLPAIVDALLQQGYVKDDSQQPSVQGESANELLTLPGKDVKERALQLCLLLVGAGAEFGSLPFTLLGLDTLKRHQLHLRPEDSGLLTAAHAKHSRRSADWKARSCGQLRTLGPKWLKEYFPRVIAERSAATSRLTPISEATAGSRESLSSRKLREAIHQTVHRQDSVPSIHPPATTFDDGLRGDTDEESDDSETGGIEEHYDYQTLAAFGDTVSQRAEEDTKTSRNNPSNSDEPDGLGEYTLHGIRRVSVPQSEQPEESEADDWYRRAVQKRQQRANRVAQREAQHNKAFKRLQAKATRALDEKNQPD